MGAIYKRYLQKQSTLNHERTRHHQHKQFRARSTLYHSFDTALYSLLNMKKKISIAQLH